MFLGKKLPTTRVANIILPKSIKTLDIVSICLSDNFILKLIVSLGLNPFQLVYMLSYKIT